MFILIVLKVALTIEARVFHFSDPGMSEQILGLRLFKEVYSCMTLVGDISNSKATKEIQK